MAWGGKAGCRVASGERKTTGTRTRAQAGTVSFRRERSVPLFASSAGMSSSVLRRCSMPKKGFGFLEYFYKTC